MIPSLFRARRSARPVSRRRFTPTLEGLEDRTVPSGVTLTPAHPGVFDPSTATWYLRSSNNAGAPDAGQFKYGMPGWVPVSGDWTGSGQTGIGVFDPNTATWYLRKEATDGSPDAGQFQYGMPGWIPVVGDWTGTGHTGIGVIDPATETWYLRNEVGPGSPDAGQFQYGAPGWLPVTGDWTGTGKTGVGVVDPATETWYLRNEAGPGAPDAGQFQYGAPGWLPVAGNWTGTASNAGVGVFDPNTGTWYLRNEAGPGAPDAGQFQYGGSAWKPVVGNWLDGNSAPAAGTQVLHLVLNPLDINLLGLEVQTNQIQVTVTAQPGSGKLLGNLLTTVSNLLNLQGVNTALNNVLDSVVNLLNSTSLTLSGANTSSGPLVNGQTATTPVLDAFVAPVHLDLLGAVVDTSPIHLTITAHSGQGLILGNVVTDLANLFNPPLPDKLDLDTINAKLKDLLGLLDQQIPGVVSSPTNTPPAPAGSERILSLTLAPINLNLLGLILKTSQIQVNADAQTGNGMLLGNVLTTLLNTLGATPQNLSDLSTNLNALLAKVIGILNDASLILPSNIVSTLSQVLQTLAVPNLVTATGTASVPVLNLMIDSANGSSPPVDVNLLGVVVTTSNIDAQLIAQTGDGQILGNLVYNVSHLLDPGGSLNLLAILNELGL